jgi:hypothetical protein
MHASRCGKGHVQPRHVYAVRLGARCGDTKREALRNPHCLLRLRLRCSSGPRYEILRLDVVENNNTRDRAPP